MENAMKNFDDDPLYDVYYYFTIFYLYLKKGVFV